MVGESSLLAGMRFQRQKGRFRAIAGGRQAVRAEADPSKERDQGHVVEYPVVGEIPSPADQHIFRQTKHIHIQLRLPRVNG
jgi:hypothetical protein